MTDKMNRSVKEVCVVAIGGNITRISWDSKMTVREWRLIRARADIEINLAEKRSKNAR